MTKTSAKGLMIVQSHYLKDPRVRREAEALAEAGYGIDVISLRAEGEPFEQVVNGVHIFAIALSRKHGSRTRYLYEYGVFLVCAGTLAAWLHLRRRYKLIQIHNLPDTLVFAALLPKLLRAKVVFDAHEAMPESLRIKYGWSEDSIWTHLTVALEQVSMALADHVLTIHEPMRQLLIRRGASPEKVSVVMNWSDERLFRLPEGERPAPDNGFTLIYAGTVAERYGIQTAIRALPLLIPEIPGLCLRVLGRGDYTAPLQQLARELGVEGFVSFETPVPLVEMPAVYRSADVGISPHEDQLFGSIYFSTKVAEYLAAGLPAIVARTPIMECYYDDSQVAFFTPGDHVDFATRVYELFQDQTYRNRLIENGLNLSQRYNWSQERGKYLDVMTELASRR